MGIRTPFARIWHTYCIAMVVLPAWCSAVELARPTGEIAGRVVDRAGHPVPGASVRIQSFRSIEVIATGTSDTEGRFVTSDVPAAPRLHVLVDAEGCGREHREDVAVFPDRTTDVGTIRVFPGCVWSGRVVDPAGKPIAGVEVFVRANLYELGHTIAHFGSPWRIKTDSDGRFASPPLPVCYAVIEHIKLPAGLVSTRNPVVHIAPGTSELDAGDVRAEPEVLLEGTVTDSKGQPVADAEVYYTPGDPRTNSVRTDSAGRFQLRGLSAKTIREARVGVEAKGLAEYFEQQPKDELPRKIVLAPCGYISGRAVDVESGGPVRIKQVWVCEVRRDEKGVPHSYGCGETRFEQLSQGEFRILVSTPGEKHLMILADGYQRAEDYVSDADRLKEDQVVELKMRRLDSRTTAAKQRVHGVVRRSGEPAANVWVSLWQKRKESDPVNAAMLRGRTVEGGYRPAAIDALTGSDGGYLLDIADPGEYYVVARPYEGAPAVSAPLNVEADAEQTCALELTPAATIRGRVVGLEPKVAEQLWVVAFGRAPFRAATAVESDGKFVLRDVPAGEAGLKVGHEGYLDEEVPRYPWPEGTWDKDKFAEPWKRAVRVTVRSGAVVDGVELEYPPAGLPDGEVE